MTAAEHKAGLRAKEHERFGKWAGRAVGRPMDPRAYQPVVTEPDIAHLRNTMATGNYPLSMSDCEVVGINGDCGSRCPVLQRGECPDQTEMACELGKTE